MIAVAYEEWQVFRAVSLTSLACRAFTAVAIHQRIGSALVHDSRLDSEHAALCAAVWAGAWGCRRGWGAGGARAGEVRGNRLSELCA